MLKILLKMEHANVLNSYDENIMFMIMNLENIFYMIETKKKTWNFLCNYYWNCFYRNHYMAANYVEEPAGFFPPYVEKKIVYPELYKKKSLIIINV